MRQQQKGMAVIMALLIVALAATATTLVMWQQKLWLRETQRDLHFAQFQLITQAGLGWAEEILRYDKESSSHDYLGELWAQPLPKNQVEGAEIQGTLEDAQGRFNVNNLVKMGSIDPVQYQYYRRLLQQLSLPDSLADTLVDWLDTDDIQRPGGAETTQYYSKLSRPYPAYNGLMQRVEQLSWVKGYTPDVIAKLEPLITALPQQTGLNINTAKPELMRALVVNVGEGELLSVLNARKTNFFLSSQDFLSRLSTGAAFYAGIQLSTDSQYFLFNGQIQQGNTSILSQALISVFPSMVDTVWFRQGQRISIGENEK